MLSTQVQGHLLVDPAPLDLRVRNSGAQWLRVRAHVRGSAAVAGGAWPLGVWQVAWLSFVSYWFLLGLRYCHLATWSLSLLIIHGHICFSCLWTVIGHLVTIIQTSSTIIHHQRDLHHSVHLPPSICSSTSIASPSRTITNHHFSLWFIISHHFNHHIDHHYVLWLIGYH